MGVARARARARARDRWRDVFSIHVQRGRKAITALHEMSHGYLEAPPTGNSCCRYETGFDHFPRTRIPVEAHLSLLSLLSTFVPYLSSFVYVLLTDEIHVSSAERDRGWGRGGGRESSRSTAR